MTLVQEPREDAMRRLSILVGLVVLLLASSCGGGGKTSPTGTPGPNETPAAGATLPLHPEEPALYVINADGSGLRRLADESWYGDLHVSPDGEQLVVSSQRDAETIAVSLLNIATGERQQVTQVTGSMRFAGWSPDGAQLLFGNYGDDPNEWGVYVYSLASGTMQRVPTPAAQFVAWSPGSQALFVQRGGEAAQPRVLSRVELPSLETREIFQGLFEYYYADVSPDGQQLALATFEGAVGKGTAKIILVQVDGSGQRELLNLQDPKSFGIGGIAWSPDGSRIAFGRQAFGDAHLGGIYVADVATGAMTRVTAPAEGVDLGMTWSRDGARLLVLRHVCTQCDGPGSKAALAAADGSGEVPLPGTEEFLDGESAWSPDGRQFVYAADKLYLADADGSNVRALVDMPGSGYGSVAWAGAGRILFVRRAPLPTTAYAVQPDGSDLEVLGVGALSVARDGESVVGQDGDGLYIRPGDREPVRLHGAALEEAGLTENVTPQLVAWSPDSRWALLAFHPTGGTALAIASRDGGVRVAAPAGWEGEVRWSPDSRRFAYWSDGAIWLASVEGGDPQRLTGAVGRPGLDWSPDGTRLAFIEETDVRVVRTDGSSTAAQFLFAVSLQQYSGNTLRWSPDGERIAVSNGRDLAIGEVETPQVTQLPPQLEIFGLEWSQNGDALIFGARPTPPPSALADELGVYVAGATGGKPHALALSSGRLYEVAGRLADGRIVFISHWTL